MDDLEAALRMPPPWVPIPMSLVGEERDLGGLEGEVEGDLPRPPPPPLPIMWT